MKCFLMYTLNSFRKTNDFSHSKRLLDVKELLLLNRKISGL